jgi:tRNA(adenine34) deaminase
MTPCHKGKHIFMIPLAGRVQTHYLNGMNKTPFYWTTLLNLTETAARCGEVPVAALLVSDQGIIAEGFNQVETLNDPTQHAEIIVLKQGFQRLGKHLGACDLYVSLEPCPMCAHAIQLSQVRRLYFGAYDPKGGAIDHGPRLLQGLDRIQTFGGFHEQEFQHILSRFFQNLRS